MKKLLFLTTRVNKTLITLMILIMFCMIVTGGYLYYRNEKKQVRNEKINELKNTSDLKVRQIERWLKNRQTCSFLYTENSMIFQKVQQLINQNDSLTKQQINDLFGIIQFSYQFEDIFIVSNEVELLIGLDPSTKSLDPTTIEFIKKVMATNEALNSDLYYCPLHQTIHLDFLAPYRDAQNNPFAVLILRVNPNDYLYPLIQNRPTQSKTFETLIVRRDGDSVLFLSELRYKPNSALNLRIPITDTVVPAVKAVLGYVGIWEGKDYRGVDVLSDIRPISGSDWYMITKIDQNEIYSELYFRAIIIVIIALLVFLLFGIGLSWYFGRKQKQILLKLVESRSALQESQEEFKTTLYSIGDAVITTNIMGFIRNMNNIAESLTGWKETDAVGKPIEDVFQIVYEETHEKVSNPIQKVLNEGLVVGLANQTLLISKNGTEIPIADSGAPVKNDKDEIVGVVLVFRDQSEERLANKILNSRLLLSEFSIKHSIKELLRFILKELGILTNSPAGFYFMIDSTQSAITLLASFDKISFQNGSVNGETHSFTIKEAGILCDVFNQKEHLIFNNYELLPDEKKIPGIIMKLSRILVVPLIKNNQVKAMMIMADKMEEYSQKDVDTVKLFLNLSWEIAERKENESAIKESEKKYSDLFNLMTEGVAIHKMIKDSKNEYVEYMIVDVNNSYEKHTGLKKDQIINLLSCDAYQSDQAPYLDIYKNVMLTGQPTKFETYFHGLKKYFYITAFKKDDSHFVTVFEDITTRKQSEIKLHHKETLLNLMGSTAKVGGWELDVETNEQLWTEEVYNIHELDLNFNPNYEKGINFYAPSSKPIIEEAIEDAIKYGKSFDLILELITAKGINLWVHSIGKALRENNVTKKIFGSIQNITEQVNAMEVLKESESRLREVQEMAHLGFWDWDVNTGAVEWSDEVYKIFKLDPKEFTPQIESILELSPWTGDHERNQELIQRAMASHDVGFYEQKFIRPDQTIGYYYSTFQGKYDPSGTLIRIVGTVLDITERKIAEKALLLKNIVFDNSIAANSIADIYGSITEVNDAFRILWGYKHKNEIIGNNISYFLQNEKESVEIINTLKAHGKWKGEFTAKRKNGSTFDAFALATDLKDQNGEFLGFQSAVLDITERKKNEREIAVLYENLEERVIQRTNQLESVNKELESFSYSVSHDLRAPLRAINGFVNILTEDYSPLLDEEGKRVCSVIAENSVKMGMLIDNLLSFSRLGRAQMTIVSIDMQETVETILKELTNEKKRSSIEFECGTIERSNGDPVLIGQVWTNLISNAIKYTSKREKAIIKISSSKEKKQCIYRIQDNGVGFDMTYKDKLFGVFQRLHGEKEYEGNGVGLAIVKRIIERHGGQVWAEGQLDKGASFYFSLPINNF